MLLIGVGVLLAVAAYHQTVLLRPGSLAEVVVGTLLLWQANLVAVSLVVGALLQSFTAVAVVVAAALVAAGSVAATSVSTRRGDSALVFRAVLVGGRGVVADLRHDLWASAVAALALVQVAWRATLGARLPVTDWDGLYYHLVGPASWVRQGAIVHTPTLASDPLANPLFPVMADVFPQNAELGAAVSILLRGDDAWADLIQLPWAGLCVVAVAAMARLAGCRRSTSIAAGALILLSPVVFTQMATAYVDIAAAAGVVAGLYFLAAGFSRRHEGRAALRPRLLLAGVAFGLAAGTKGTNVPAVAVGLLLAVLVVVWTPRNESDGRWGWASCLAVFVVPLLALGTFWYARNLVTYGNPVFPFSLELGPVHLIDGPVPLDPDAQLPPELSPGDGSIVQIASSWFSEPHGSYVYDQRMGGFGVQWPWLMLPAIAVGSVLLLRRQPAVVGLFTLPIFLLLVVQPMPWWSRFTIALLAPGCVCLGVCIDRLRGKSLGPLLQLVVVGAVLVSSWRGTSSLSVTNGQLAAGQTWDLVWSPPEERAFGAFAWGEYLTLGEVEDGATIAVHRDASVFAYPLLGAGRRGAVTIGTPSGPEDLLHLLEEAGAQYLYVQQGSVEEVAAQETAGRLVSVGAEWGWTLWRLDEVP